MGHPQRGARSVPEIAVLAATAVVVRSARRAKSGGVHRTEETVFRSVNGLSDAIEKPVWLVMQTGSLAAVFVAAGELQRRGERATAVSALVTGVAVWGGVKLIKPQIGRGRPGAELPDVAVRGQPQTGLGYPSGHAAVALTLALISTRTSSRSVRTAALAAAGTTGLARMYVGAHLPLDVAGGFGIGMICGTVANAIGRRRGKA